MFTVENPTMEDCLKAFKAAVRSGRLLIMVGEFRVDYFGRGHSELGYGERILIVKSDGSLLIHRPTHVEPVNWQPPGSLYRAYVKEGGLTIEAYRKKPEERVRITFRKVSLLTAHKLRDDASFKLYTAEEVMREAFMKNPELVEKNLRVISREKRLKSGLVDCFCVDSAGRPVVVEFKKGRAGVEAVKQLSNYVRELRKGNPRVRGILVAPSLTREASEAATALNLEYRRLSVRKCIKILESLSEPTKLSDFLEN